MKITINADRAYQTGLQDIVRIFYPGCEINTGTADIAVSLFVEEKNTGILATAKLQSNSLEQTHREKNAIQTNTGTHNEIRRMARLAVYRVLEKYTQLQPSPWGIMTNTRPTKLVHRLFDSGYPREKVRSILINNFALAPEKAELITGIVLYQRPYLPTIPGASKEIAIYAGIPFCPSRCLYCSFPSYPKNKYGKWIEHFLNTILKEIKEVGELIGKKSLHVNCIYLGGGTPTSLEPEQLAKILEAIRYYFVTPNTEEITVEGGRPETLTPEIINTCQKHGANRLSINPQSMQEKTLKVIGRNHSINDIYEAMNNARAAGIQNINMDIIAGLPGESTTDLQDTLEKITELKPDNLSVHTLAIKNSSQLRKELDRHPLPSPEEANDMVRLARQEASEMGMHPYYMYRQKNILGQLENTGYTLPGRESLYNIMMMEERHTVIGMGVGAGSKYILPGEEIYNRHNPKDLAFYIERIDEIIETKKHMLAAFDSKNSVL